MLGQGEFSMKFHTTLLIIVLTGFASLSSAADNPRCLAEYKAEEARITRDAGRAAAANPPGRDTKAQQQFMIPVYEALKAAAERAEQCNRENLQPRSAASNLLEKQCADKADQQIAELDRRNADRTNLPRGEQMELRDEQNRISDARMDCMQKAR
jgi:hypothetical protein